MFKQIVQTCSPLPHLTAYLCITEFCRCDAAAFWGLDRSYTQAAVWDSLGNTMAVPVKIYTTFPYGGKTNNLLSYLQMWLDSTCYVQPDY